MLVKLTEFFGRQDSVGAESVAVRCNLIANTATVAIANKSLISSSGNSAAGAVYYGGSVASGVCAARVLSQTYVSAAEMLEYMQNKASVVRYRHL